MNLILTVAKAAEKNFFHFEHLDSFKSQLDIIPGFGIYINFAACIKRPLNFLLETKTWRLKQPENRPTN